MKILVLYIINPGNFFAVICDMLVIDEIGLCLHKQLPISKFQ